MAGSRKPHGTIPAAFSASGEDVPPSSEGAEDGLAQAIGIAVAFYTGQILEPMLAGIAERLDKLIAQQQGE